MKRVFFWKVLIATIVVLLLVNVISLAAYTYVGKNTYISLTLDELEPQAEYTRKVYEEFKSGSIDQNAFNILIEQQTIAGDSAILIADQVGKALIVRDIGNDVQVKEYGVSFSADIQKVLEGETVRDENMLMSENDPAISVGIPVRDADGTVTGAVFIIKEISRLQDAFRKLSDSLMLVLALTLPVAMLLVVVITNSVIKPLTEMSNVAIQMSKGYFNVRADESFSGEVGILARALNQLCENLSNTIYQLRSEKQQLNSLITSFSDGVAAIDRDGNLTHYNPAVQQMFGSVTASTPMELIPDASIWDGYREVLETKQPQTLQYKLPGNRSLWISLVPIASEDGTCSGAVGLFKDVTEFERLEQTRRDYVANISHELRTPLTAVRGLLEPLADGMVQDENTRKRYYDTMLHEVQRLSRLITDMLQLSKLQSGTEYLDVGAVNTQELLEDVFLNYKSEAAQKKINLVLDAENVPYSMTDRDRIEQVLVILIDNAMRYTPENGTITISAVTGDCIIVSVIDTGCGIAGEELPHLFERFYKVDKSRKDGGTGLGLSIAKQIIDMLGERITVESEVGKGTCFSFTLKKFVSNAIALGPTAEFTYDPKDPVPFQNGLMEAQDAPYEVIKPKKKKSGKSLAKRTKEAIRRRNME